jgi:hypothetical protein
MIGAFTGILLPLKKECLLLNSKEDVVSIHCPAWLVWILLFLLLWGFGGFIYGMILLGIVGSC